jgi:hypothetical protein
MMQRGQVNLPKAVPGPYPGNDRGCFDRKDRQAVHQLYRSPCRRTQNQAVGHVCHAERKGLPPADKDVPTAKSSGLRRKSVGIERLGMVTEPPRGNEPRSFPTTKMGIPDDGLLLRHPHRRLFLSPGIPFTARFKEAPVYCVDILTCRANLREPRRARKSLAAPAPPQHRRAAGDAPAAPTENGASLRKSDG